MSVCTRELPRICGRKTCTPSRQQLSHYCTERSESSFESGITVPVTGARPKVRVQPDAAHARGRVNWAVRCHYQGIAPQRQCPLYISVITRLDRTAKNTAPVTAIKRCDPHKRAARIEVIAYPMQCRGFRRAAFVRCLNIRLTNWQH